jgi:hypothetical protein
MEEEIFYPGDKIIIVMDDKDGRHQARVGEIGVLLDINCPKIAHGYKYRVSLPDETGPITVFKIKHAKTIIQETYEIY